MIVISDIEGPGLTLTYIGKDEKMTVIAVSMRHKDCDCRRIHVRHDTA